jgi:hypothetical protein
MDEISKLDIYKEQYAHLRSMNEILYKIPSIFTAIIGGLWYFAVLNIENHKPVACAVFLFAAVSSICFVNVMQRFRLAFNAYIDNLNKMDGEMKVSIRPAFFPSTIATVQMLLWTAFLVSIGGIFYSIKC